MTYCFDIDGTICSNTDGEYEKAQPYAEAIRAVNALYQEGNTIYFYTARGSTTGIDWRATTEKQLAQWGVTYHRLFFGKPNADVYVDDKGINLDDWMKLRHQNKSE
jgi:ribonucleotide monophosphatase NagD (HAD superfamily)